MKSIAKAWNSLSLVKQIIIGLVIGIILAMIAPDKLGFVTIFGDLFVKALKAVAPVLVLFLVMSAICQHKKGQKTNMKTVIVLYLVGTFMAGTLAVVASFIFKPTLILATADTGDVTPPEGISQVINQLLTNLVANPVDAVLNANFLGVLAWALVLGFALKRASDTTKGFIQDLADGLSTMVRWVIRFAPLGIMGLVFNSVATTGFDGMKKYVGIIILLVAVMLVDALVINPIIVFITCKRNPYPLILRCLKDSGITAFFTRSSAANIPVNMGLCESLGLNKDTYGVSIPLGATINMGGAAITISVLSLAAAHSLGIAINPLSAIILCVLSAASACGASGVAGGSLLLIPLACSLFGIPVDIAMEVVGVGFIIGVVQDSCETALNSSTDVVFTAAAEYRELRKQEKKGTPEV